MLGGKKTGSRLVALEFRQPSINRPFVIPIAFSKSLFKAWFFHVNDNQMEKEKECQSEQKDGYRRLVQSKSKHQNDGA